jgi:glycosyltransferase involved in cell wall biosynthesis
MRAQPGITLISQANRGLGSSRNLGMSLARGTYGIFLDSDDSLHIDKVIEAIQNVMSPENLDLLFFDTQPFLWRKNGDVALLERYTRYYRRSSYVLQDAVPGSTLAQSMADENSYLVSSCLYVWRRKFLLEEKVTFSEGVLMEDNFFTYACLKKAGRALYLPQQLHRRSVRPDSISQGSPAHRVAEGYLDAHGSIRKLQGGEHPVLSGEKKALRSTQVEARKRTPYLTEEQLQTLRVNYQEKFKLSPTI